MNHITPCHLCFLVLLIPRQTFSLSSDSSVDCFRGGRPLSGKPMGVHGAQGESLGKAALDISVWFVTWSWHSKASTSSSFSGKTRSSHSPDWNQREGEKKGILVESELMSYVQNDLLSSYKRASFSMTVCRALQIQTTALWGTSCPHKLASCGFELVTGLWRYGHSMGRGRLSSLLPDISSWHWHAQACLEQQPMALRRDWAALSPGLPHSPLKHVPCLLSCENFICWQMLGFIHQTYVSKQEHCIRSTQTRVTARRDADTLQLQDLD